MPHKKEKPSGAQYRKCGARAQLEFFFKKNTKIINKYFKNNNGITTSTLDPKNSSINDINKNISNTSGKPSIINNEGGEGRHIYIYLCINYSYKKISI